MIKWSLRASPGFLNVPAFAYPFLYYLASRGIRPVRSSGIRRPVLRSPHAFLQKHNGDEGGSKLAPHILSQRLISLWPKPRVNPGFSAKADKLLTEWQQPEHI